MTRDAIDWWRRLGIICGAIIAAGTIISWISAQAWSLATQPIVSEIHALKATDERLAHELRMFGQDRIELIDALTTQNPAARDRKFEMIRARWAHEALQP